MSTVMHVTESYERCLESPDFFECFYQIFIQRVPEAREVIGKDSLTEHQLVLRKGVSSMIMFATKAPASIRTLEQIREQLAAHGIADHPHLYQAAMEALVETVRAFDPKCTASMENSWRNTLNHALHYLMPVDGAAFRKSHAPNR